MSDILMQIDSREVRATEGMTVLEAFACGTPVLVPLPP